MNRAAQQLGRLAKGVPKNFSPAEIERRRQHMHRVNAARRAAGEKRTTTKPRRVGRSKSRKRYYATIAAKARAYDKTPGGGEQKVGPSGAG